jgi:hypothetical protein
MSIVFYQGRPLFRNGMIAMNANCCCAGCVFDFDCMGNCWFPVTQPERLLIGDPLLSVTEQTGGATQIQNLYYEVTEEVYSTGAYFKVTQNATSQHGITGRRCITDRNDPNSFGDEVILRSRYFWRVFCDIENGDDSGGYPNISTTEMLVLFDENGWTFSLFGLGPPPGFGPMGVGQCSGTLDFTWTSAGGNRFFSIDVVGGLQLPSGFTCTDGFIHKNGSRFYGTKSDFPSNYFPTS